jgi:hypothetical protein
MTTAELLCGSCGTQLGATAKFCSECSASVTQHSRSAEYKQVTMVRSTVPESLWPELARKLDGMVESGDQADDAVEDFDQEDDEYGPLKFAEIEDEDDF